MLPNSVGPWRLLARLDILKNIEELGIVPVQPIAAQDGLLVALPVRTCHLNLNFLMVLLSVEIAKVVVAVARRELIPQRHSV